MTRDEGRDVTETLALPASISRTQAWSVLASRLEGAQALRVEKTYHPFTGVVWDIAYARRRLRAANKIYTLVDGLGGSAFIAQPWPRPAPLDQAAAAKLDWTRRRVSHGDALRTARQAAAISIMRRVKIGQRFDLVESELYRTLWKPNWRVLAGWKGVKVSVLVDGLDGSHYVIGSSS